MLTPVPKGPSERTSGKAAPERGRARGGSDPGVTHHLAPRRAEHPYDRKTADRQLHLICEGWKKGLRLAGLRQLVVRFYGPEIKPCQLHWTEIDRLIIEIWRHDLRKDG